MAKYYGNSIQISTAYYTCIVYLDQMCYCASGFVIFPLFIFRRHNKTGIIASCSSASTTLSLNYLNLNETRIKCRQGLH